MITREQVDKLLSKYRTDSAKIQETDSKILVWDSEFVFQANKLGKFWYVTIQK